MGRTSASQGQSPSVTWRRGASGSSPGSARRARRRARPAHRARRRREDRGRPRRLGLDRRHRLRGGALRLARVRSRAGLPPRAPAGRPRDPAPGGARLRRRGPGDRGRALARRQRTRRHLRRGSGVAVLRRAPARRGRREGGAPHRDRPSPRRPVRHGDRRLPHPRPQRVRRTGPRVVGARHRRRPLPPAPRRRRRSVGAVAARAGACSAVAQGRRRLPGHCADCGRGDGAARAPGVRARRPRTRPAARLVRHGGRDAAESGAGGGSGRRARRRAASDGDAQGSRRRGTPVTSTSGRSPRRRAFGFVLTALAALIVWVALVAPTPTVGWSPTPLDLLRGPVEGIVLVAGLLALRGRATWWFAGVVGVLLGLLLVLRVLNAAFLDTVYRPFYPVTDWRYAGSFKDLISDSTGPLAAALAAAGAAALLIGLLVLTPLALHRVGALLGRHRRGAMRAVVVAAVLWVAGASLGVHLSPDLPVASSSAVALGRDTATAVRDGLHDRDVFGAQIPLDAFRGARQGNLLSALAGKDVV